MLKEPTGDLALLTVGDLMTTKVVTLAEYEDMNLASGIMKLGRIRHLPVVDDLGRLTGLVTHRDLLRVSISEACEHHESPDAHKDVLRSIPVDSVMQRDVRTVLEDTPLTIAAHTILENKYGCLPVVNTEGVLVGIVTEADFVGLTLWLLKLLGGDEPPASDGS